MSGIGALLSLRQASPEPQQWQAMARALAPYGADGQQSWQAPTEPLVLLHALCAITPQDRVSGCVVSSPDGRWLLIADARLDAREDLAARLQLPVPAAASSSDTELIAHAFARWQLQAAEQLLGGFAVIAWDRHERCLHLVVDANGERQLYFQRSAAHVAVSNRAPALLALPNAARSVDVQALLGFFTDRREPWRTTLLGVATLPPGYRVTLRTDGGCSRSRWWAPPSVHAWRATSLRDPVAEFQRVFTAAVCERLRSSGISGGLCSGGLDSTAVSALAADWLAQRGQRYHTYTSVPHPDWVGPARIGRWEADERPYVTALVRHQPNIAASFVAVAGTIFLDCLPALFAGAAWPVRNTANMPWLFAIGEVMRADGVRLPLSGNRGNATVSFDGPVLPDLLFARRFDLLLQELRASPRAFAAGLRELLSVALINVYRQVPAVAVAKSTQHWREVLVLRPEAAHRLASLAATKTPLRAWSTAEVRRRFQYMQQSMATPLQLPIDHGPLLDTDPTADRRIQELCWSLRPSEYRHGGQRRHLIRRAMRGWLPDEIRLRTTRGAQAPDAWLHLSTRVSDLRLAIDFVAEDPACRELLDVEQLRRWLDEWQISAPKSAALIPFERSLSLGLYWRWINEGLTELPGARAPASPLVSRSFS